MVSIILILARFAAKPLVARPLQMVTVIGSVFMNLVILLAYVI